MLALLLAGCRIEPTPAEYIDVLEIPQDEIGASREELTDRLRSTASALERRNISDLLSALLPAAEMGGIGPEPDAAVDDATSLAYALTTPTIGRTVGLEEVTVRVGPQNNVAWFQAAYRLEQADLPEELRFSGVFLRQEGEWRLVQAHISRPISPQAGPSPAQVDTPAGGG